MLKKLKKISMDRNTKMVASLVVLLALIVSPVVFAKNSPSREIAKAGENSPTPTPTATPAESKISEPTPTPQPAKTETPRTPTPRKQQTQAPARNYSGRGNTTTQGTTSSRPRASTNSNSTVQPSTPAPAPQPAASGILGYINQVRAENGLVQLTYNSQLNSAAKAKSQDMLNQNYFSHTSPDGRSDFDFIKAAGYIYRFAGSNIAKGNFSERSVFDAWMNSSGHRANILDSRAREFGYGVAGNYFTMMVGSR